MNATTESAAERRGSRRPFWLLVALFFGPLAVAFLLYYGLEGWQPAGSTARGDLIDPARPLPQVALETPSGTLMTADVLRGHWSLVYVGDGACDERCRTALADMRQVRLALGDEMTRVERVFLYTDAGTSRDRDHPETEHTGVIVAGIDGADGDRLLAEFPVYEGIPAGKAGRIYVVDPLGNLMMSYAPQAPPRGMLDDLKKLLKLSHIG